MKVYSLKKQLVFIYIYMLLYLVAGYFYNSFLKEKDFYEFVENYFGITSFVILFVMMISAFSFLIGCRRKKMVFRIRLNFFILLLCSLVVVYFARKIGIPFDKVVANNEQLKQLVESGLYEYHIGLFFIFVLGWTFTKVMGIYIYSVASFIIFVSLFFLFAKMVRVTISNIVWNIKESNRLKRERKLLQEQIRLKEYYEQLERERLLREKKEKELLEQIQKERAEMEKIGAAQEEETSENTNENIDDGVDEKEVAALGEEILQEGEEQAQEENQESDIENKIEVQEDVDTVDTAEKVDGESVEEIDENSKEETSIEENSQENSDTVKNESDNLENEDKKIDENEENLETEEKVEETERVTTEERETETRIDEDMKKDENNQTQEEILEEPQEEKRQIRRSNCDTSFKISKKKGDT